MGIRQGKLIEADEIGAESQTARGVVNSRYEQPAGKSCSNSWYQIGIRVQVHESNGGLFQSIQQSPRRPRCACRRQANADAFGLPNRSKGLDGFDQEGRALLPRDGCPGPSFHLFEFDAVEAGIKGIFSGAPVAFERCFETCPIARSTSRPPQTCDRDAARRLDRERHRAPCIRLFHIMQAWDGLAHARGHARRLRNHQATGRRALAMERRQRCTGQPVHGEACRFRGEHDSMTQRPCTDEQGADELSVGQGVSAIGRDGIEVGHWMQWADHDSRASLGPRWRSGK